MARRRFPEWPMLGAGLLLACGLAWASARAGTAAARPEIVVTRAAVERMREARVRETGLSAPPPELARLVDEVVEEEILWREGRALLRGGGDPAVRSRVDALRRELEAGRTGEDDVGDAAAPEAVASLARTDAVLRRHLVEAARLALARQAAGPPPSDEDVDAWASRSPDRFGRPARLRFEQVFLSRARRGASIRTDAAALLARLEGGTAERAAGSASPGDGGDDRSPGSPRDVARSTAGDAFPIGASFTGSPAEVDRAFGPGFARRVADLPRGRWAGPVDSPLGVHLVRLLDSTAPESARAESVRGRAALAWRRERSRDLLRDRLAALRAGYEIRVLDEVDAGPGRMQPASTAAGS